MGKTDYLFRQNFGDPQRNIYKNRRELVRKHLRLGHEHLRCRE